MHLSMYTCTHTCANHRRAYSIHMTHREEKVRGKGGERDEYFFAFKADFLAPRKKVNQPRKDMVCTGRVWIDSSIMGDVVGWDNISCRKFFSSLLKNMLKSTFTEWVL